MDTHIINRVNTLKEYCSTATSDVMKILDDELMPIIKEIYDLEEIYFDVKYKLSVFAAIERIKLYLGEQYASYSVIIMNDPPYCSIENGATIAKPYLEWSINCHLTDPESEHRKGTRITFVCNHQIVKNYIDYQIEMYSPNIEKA
jgi:hypothetical protein